MPIDAVFAQAIEAARAAGHPELSDGAVLEFRATLEQTATALGAGPGLPDVVLHRIASRSGTLDAYLYRPLESARGLVVYLHGGGWVGGSRVSYDQLCRRLALLSGYSLLFVEYRLAPEHRFPSALQDVEDALIWADQNRAALSCNGAELVLAGDSAGANLAAVVSNVMRARLDIARQVLFYPVVDCKFDTTSYQRFAEGLNITRRDMQWFFAHYALPHEWTDPRISPLQGPVASSPPTWIGLAEYDVLNAEGAAFAERLAAAGIPVCVITYDGAIHGFARWFNLSEVARKATEDAARAIRGAAFEHGRA